MKKQFLTFFTVLLALTNWLHTANAQPTTTITTPPSDTQTGVFDVTVTFSEAVTGFDQTELSVTGTANATITAWTAQAGGRAYGATITPKNDGTVVFNVAENVAEAGANNGNTAATEQTEVLIPETVWMPDEYLRRFVKQKMLIPIPYATPLTQATLSSLMVLLQERITARPSSADILQNLTGLEYAINLSRLTLHKNSISDLTPLQNLTKLTEFESTRSSISNITPLQNLTNLGVLTLNANSISDISALQNLTNLRELDLGGNSISTITSLQNLTNLRELKFSNNSISDLTPLQNLTNLTDLDLESNQIEDVAPLARLTKLNSLRLYGNPFRSRFPMVEIEVPDEIQTGAFDVTMRFNEDVTGFEQADLSVSGAAATITEWAEVTAEREYTATITPTEEGTVTLTIAKGAAQGKRKQALRTLKVSKPSMKIYLGSGPKATSTELQDPNNAATPKDVEVDITRPSVDITVPTTPQAGVFDVTVVFAEPVTDFMQSKLTVTGAGASITDWTPVDGDEEYTAEITPTAEGTVTLSVAENVAQDAAGNQNTASPSRTVEIDMTPPSVTIIGVPTGVQNRAFDVTVTFSEDVTGFTSSDIALTNSGGTDTVVATATVTGSGKTYTATITPTGGGTLGIQVPADAVVDAASNGNTVSAKHIVEVDTARPGVTITGVPATTQNTAFTVTITFSVTVTGFTDSDITLSNSGVTADTASATTTVTGTGTTYTATLTPSGEGTLTIQVPADAAFNSENKGNVASAVHTVAIEAVPPTVTITGVPTTPQNSEFDVAITFSEDVTGFTADDIAFSNSGGTDTATTTATLKADSDDNDATYTATITPTGTGSLSIQVPANAAVDAVNNGNTASSTHPVAVDADPPTVRLPVFLPPPKTVHLM